jgi:hypothetical protein
MGRLLSGYGFAVADHGFATVALVIGIGFSGSSTPPDAAKIESAVSIPD